MHLTYTSVTLHFPDPLAFINLARTWGEVMASHPIRDSAEIDPHEWILELDYRRTTIRLFADEALDMEQMMREAAENLQTFLGRTEESAWPEGDVPVPIPDFSRVPYPAAQRETRVQL